MTASSLSTLSQGSRITKELFRTAAGHWATGVAVITTVDREERPFGLTASSVTSLSIEPLQFLICVDNKANSLPAMLDSQRFCINFLASGQEEVARAFASKRDDKFSGLSWSQLPSGLPVVDGVLAYVACDIAAVHDGGDHQIIIGKVHDIHVSGGDPLMYFKGAFRQLV